MNEENIDLEKEAILGNKVLKIVREFCFELNSLINNSEISPDYEYLIKTLIFEMFGIELISSIEKDIIKNKLFEESYKDRFLKEFYTLKKLNKKQTKKPMFIKQSETVKTSAKYSSETNKIPIFTKKNQNNDLFKIFDSLQPIKHDNKFAPVHMIQEQGCIKSDDKPANKVSVSVEPNLNVRLDPRQDAKNLFDKIHMSSVEKNVKKTEVKSDDFDLPVNPINEKEKELAKAYSLYIKYKGEFLQVKKDLNELYKENGLVV